MVTGAPDPQQTIGPSKGRRFMEKDIIRTNILLTGAPGVGKTTVIGRILEAVESLHPLGFYTEEIREGGARTGFSLVST
ncbi:MAG TPA: hypothetical protein ENN35_07165, partial [Deltaproteobacteria bacterium]|nr:hypothetical protein [Deltaproteobacteria bacterium]